MSRNDILLGYLENASAFHQLHLEYLQSAREQVFPLRFLSLVLASAAHQQYQLYLQQANTLCIDNNDVAQCYIDKLLEYNVVIHGAGSFQGHTLEDFSATQLEAIFEGVQAVDGFLNPYVATYFQSAISPGESFRSVFGNIEFAYDPDQGFGLTVAPEDPDATPEQNLDLPKCLTSAIYIFLWEKSFRTTTSLLPPFDPGFVIVHELGHAFYNRQGGKRGTNHVAQIASDDFVEATGSIWNPLSDIYLSLEEYNADTYGPLDYRLNSTPDPEKPYMDKNGTPTEEPSAYVVPAGFYRPLNYGEDADPSFFPNENRPINPNPSEGFADTFANLILNRNVMPVGSARREYFESNMQDWIESILSRDSQSFCISEN